MKWAVYSPSQGWLVDTCAGGAFAWNVDEAMWFDTEEEAVQALAAAEIEVLDDFKFTRVK
jgi:hypothetical protein